MIEGVTPLRGATTETLIVIAKQPLPGRVKTRLVPPLTHFEAARLASAAIADTLEAVQDTHAQQRILAFDGVVDEWLPSGWRHVRQPAGGLDRRLAAAFTAAGHEPALLVGMDTPQLRPEHLAAFDPSTYDACLGLAPDGGYWAIGFRDPGRAAAAVHGIPMSTEYTAQAQLSRLDRLGMRVQLLDELVDVDTFADAVIVAASAPWTRFAAALAEITAPVAQAG